MGLKEAADEIQKEAAKNQRREDELRMWHAWKASDEHPDKLEPLLHSLKPVINGSIRGYIGKVPIQQAALEAEATRMTIKALRTYDPNHESGAQLASWVTSQVRMRRFVIENQNLSRITEARARRIGDYHRAQTSLNEKLEREPTAHEIADHMSVPVKMVQRLSREIRPDILASGSAEDPFLEETPRAREVLGLIEYELTPNELQVFELLTGRNGKPKLKSTSQIARRLKWNDSKVSQTKDAISKKIAPYLYG